ncbi:DUF2147 domain-containing protein [Halosquirtibacter laminarini]|uniref:DUF2147 domain-containing protein n=1 Tax=Halosquirtibacter laminarini TaxID=3374600 RepID=A0AC61NPA5_9BACT|nr:DUF2147 domain-containing protein [Prolixibacteraceae bacterium]
MKKLILITLCLFVSIPLWAKDITGIWQTFDEKTNKPKSDVMITIKDGILYGQIVALYNPDPNYNPLCKECEGSLHNKPIIGLTIINGLTKKKDIWVKDDGILDPESGKKYDVKLWEEDGKLQVRGYIGFFFRTQTWVRKR